MIQRINFIEREPLVITYRKIVCFLLILGGLLVFVGGFEKMRAVMIEKEVSRLFAEVTRLKTEKETKLKDRQGEQLSSARSQLRDLFHHSIVWSAVLQELSSRSPQSLWLTDLQCQNQDQGIKTLTLNGQGMQAFSITQFVKSLSEFPDFRNVLLKNLSKVIGPQGEFYDFSVQMEMGVLNAPPAKPVEDVSKGSL